MANPQYKGIFKHSYRGEYQNKASVYKIWAADHFFIWKCQALHNSMHHTGGIIERYVRNGPKQGDVFTNLVECIVFHSIEELEVELILQTDNPYVLLVCEYEVLQQEKNNPLCLNAVFNPHISKWIPEEDAKKFNEFKNQPK